MGKPIHGLGTDSLIVHKWRMHLSKCDNHPRWDMDAETPCSVLCACASLRLSSCLVFVLVALASFAHLELPLSAVNDLGVHSGTKPM